MGCASSNEHVLPSMNNKKNMAWSYPEPTVPPEPDLKSRRYGKNSSPIIVRIKSMKSDTNEVEDITVNKNALTILKRRNSENTLDSLGIEGESGSHRGVSSAKSASSVHTYDSGLDIDCPGMITENSDLMEVKKVEEDKRPTTPDFCLAGTKIESRKTSAGKAKPQTTADILGELKNEGLLSGAPAKAQHGMSFEVMVSTDFGVLKRPPPRLSKLKKGKKKQKELTKEEMEEKLKAAEERRKRKEAKMIQKLNTSAKERQVQSTLDSSVESQRTQTMSKLTQDLDSATQRREEHFKSLKIKMEEKKRHAERVRQAKLERLAQTPVPPVEGSMENVDEGASLV